MDMIDKKRVLFVCTGNACRSQMAEGILQYLGKNSFDVFSAGTYPTEVHPLAIEVMKEWGIYISNHTSDHVDNFLNKGIGIVITLCDSAKELCTTFPGDVRMLHWDIPDPFPGWVADPHFLVKFREVRNLIRGHIETFLYKNNGI